jgi:cell division septation protein DedD
MKDISEEKTKVLEEVSPFSNQDAEEYPEVEEEDWKEEDTPRGSHRSPLLVGLFCVIFGVLLVVAILYMKPGVKRPQLVGERIRVPITSIEKEEKPRISDFVERGKKPSEGISLEEEKPTVSEPSEPSIKIEEREVDSKKVFIFSEKEVPKEEKELKEVKVEAKRPEIEGKEEGKPQVTMVEEPKGLAIPEGKLPKGRYTVNIASFRKRGRAERLMKDLEEKGYEAFVEKANIPQKGIWYRVAVGRFSSRGEALAFARDLKEKGINYSFVRKLKEVKQ